MGHCVLANKCPAPVLSGLTHFKMAVTQVSFEKMAGIQTWPLSRWIKKSWNCQTIQDSTWRNQGNLGTIPAVFQPNSWCAKVSGKALAGRNVLQYPLLQNISTIPFPREHKKLMLMIMLMILILLVGTKPYQFVE